MGIFSWLFKSNRHTSIEELEEITSRIDPEMGFHDLFLKIVEAFREKGRQVYIAKGLYKGRQIGLRCEIALNIPKGFINGIPAQTSFVVNGVIFRTIGQESDGLIEAYSELFGMPVASKFSQQPVTATAFSLNEYAIDFDKPAHYRLKLFLGEDSEERYCELFLNIITDKMELELAEKDSDYRENILKVLTN